MKLTKKKVLAIAMAICLIATISVGTLAWFTDDDSVTNDFHIAGSENQSPDEVFSVDVWERAEEGGQKEDTGIRYPAILPGDDLYKEVNIENTGSYDQYIRATVTVTGAWLWQHFYGETFFDLNNLATDLNANFKVDRVVYDMDHDTMTYVLYYNAILPANGEDTVTLFTNVAIPEELDRYQAAALKGFQIKVVADAVQTENVGDTACKAFTTVGMHEEEGFFYHAESTDSLAKIPANRENNALDFGTADVKLNGIDNITALYIQTSANMEVSNVTMNVGDDVNYGNIITGTAVYDDVDITSNGGGIGADGAKVVFNEGSVKLTATTTNPRYNFYVVGGSELEINGGEFDFTSKTLKRAYIYADAGSTVTINGGEFGKASTRSGYTAGILGNGTVIINGGTFGFDPSAWLGDGHTATYDSATQTWTVA